MTYSIVARDAATGELGVAVQSHYFSTGRAVPWGRPGVGVVATQAQAEMSYGPRGLDLMAGGTDPGAALDQLLADDDGRESRQVAFLSADGVAAAHTGKDCITHAGHVTGDGVSCQANIMVTPEIWGAMLAAFEASLGQALAQRLLAALDAAEALGGDARGRQSAAMLIVPAEGDRWQSTLELRVDDHPEPLVELRRLVGVHDAYRMLDVLDEDLLIQGDPDAERQLATALAQSRDNHELKFWVGASVFAAGDPERGLKLVREAIAEQPGWEWLLPRLTDAQIPGITGLNAALGLTA